MLEKFPFRVTESVRRFRVIEIVKLSLVGGVNARDELLPARFAYSPRPFMIEAMNYNLMSKRSQTAQPFGKTGLA